MTAQKPERIVVHYSASDWGCALLIDQWHKDRGWKGIGYHFVILNGYTYSKDHRWKSLDGVIEPGRPLDASPWIEADEVGAHAYGYNRNTIGICLVGRKRTFTIKQIKSLASLTSELIHIFGLDVSAVVGHYELNSRTVCPEIDMENFRKYLQRYMELISSYR